MALFSRRKRDSPEETDDSEFQGASVRTELLPDINQRVSVTLGEKVPTPSRVEDVVSGRILIAEPSIKLEPEDAVVLSWEHNDAWCSLETRVAAVHRDRIVPVVEVLAAGKITRFDDRRTMERRSVELPIELRIMRSRAIATGRTLASQTIDISNNAIRFATTAPLAPGDRIEAKIRVGEGETDVIGIGLDVVRMDTVQGSWRQVCMASIEEILRSDKGRLMAIVNGLSESGTDEASTAPTAEGVGGRDEPSPISTLDDAVGWLRRQRKTDV